MQAQRMLGLERFLCERYTYTIGYMSNNGAEIVNVSLKETCFYCPPYQHKGSWDYNGRSASNMPLPSTM